MEISEIRRRNLWAKVHPNGYSEQGVKAFAEEAGKTEQRIRHIIAKHPSTRPAKNIGTNAAREFEDIFEWPRGWMDVPHPELWDIDDLSVHGLFEMELQSSGVERSEMIKLLSEETGYPEIEVNDFVSGAVTEPRGEYHALAGALEAMHGVHRIKSAQTKMTDDIQSRFNKLPKQKQQELIHFLTFLEQRK